MTTRIAVFATATAMLLGAASPMLAQDARGGVFEGRSTHETSGNAEIVQEDGGFVVKLAEDFVLDGAPDPVVGLGKDGYDPETQMGELASDTGAQSYAIPAEIDPTSYNEVWIWCRSANVPLGVAKLN